MRRRHAGAFRCLRSVPDREVRRVDGPDETRRELFVGRQGGAAEEAESAVVSPCGEGRPPAFASLDLAAALAVFRGRIGPSTARCHRIECVLRAEPHLDEGHARLLPFKEPETARAGSRCRLQVRDCGSGQALGLALLITTLVDARGLPIYFLIAKALLTALQ